MIRLSSKSAWIVATLVAAVPAAVQAQAPPENAEAFRLLTSSSASGVGSSSGPEGLDRWNAARPHRSTSIGSPFRR